MSTTTTRAMPVHHHGNDFSPVDQVTRVLRNAGLTQTKTNAKPTMSTFHVKPTRHLRKAVVSVSDYPTFAPGTLNRISSILTLAGLHNYVDSSNGVVVATVAPNQ